MRVTLASETTDEARRALALNHANAKAEGGGRPKAASCERWAAAKPPFSCLLEPLMRAIALSASLKTRCRDSKLQMDLEVASGSYRLPPRGAYFYVRAAAMCF